VVNDLQKKHVFSDLKQKSHVKGAPSPSAASEMSFADPSRLRENKVFAAQETFQGEGGQ
jgi:hypothetical protein